MSSPPGRHSDVFARRSLERVFAELKRRVRSRAPDLASRGPEDPAWVLLEAFAEALSELEEDAQLLEERLFPRVLESLGDEPRWAVPATVPIVFAPVDGAEDPIPVPRGTVVSAPRRDGEAPCGFETFEDGWTGPAKLLRAVTCAGDAHAEIFPHPQSGWDAEPVPLFAGRTSIVRHLYLGDAALLELRDRAGYLVMEWPGNPQVLGEGRWEHSVRGGWRAARVELDFGGSEDGKAGSKRPVTLRIAGPLPDLAEASIESTTLPWLRLSLDGDRRTKLGPPRWAAAGSPASGAELAFPRPVSRILSQAGERWEDHSLTSPKISPVESTEAWSPSIYLGWDRPTPGSVYWSLAGRSAPHGWAGYAAKRSPVIVWEHSSGRGFRSLDVADGTGAFTRSGTLAWDLPHEWTPQEHFGEKLCWMRARWISGAYCTNPELRALLPHAVEARQQRTTANRAIETKLDRRGRGALVLSPSDGDPERFRFLEARGEGGEWRRLAARSSGRAADAETDRGGKHEPPAGKEDGQFSLARLPRGGYVLDLGPHWSGDVTLRIPALRTTLGARGNVPAGTLTVLEGSIPGVRRALQLLAAEGGADPESSEAFRRRVRAEWRTGDRAVTSEDYRRLAMALDHEIGRVEATAHPETPGRVTIAIAHAGACEPGFFSPARLEWLAESLESKSPLGTSVDVVEPHFIPVEIAVRARGDGLLPVEELRRAAEEGLRRHFHPVVGGTDGRGFRAGRWLQASEISSIIGRILRGGDARPRMGELSILGVEIRGPGGKPVPACMESAGQAPPNPLTIPVLEKLLFELQERSSA